MAGVMPFAVPDFALANLATPTEQEINDWSNELMTVIAALNNIIAFFNLATPTIPAAPWVVAGADLAARVAHIGTLRTMRTQIILFQGQVMAESRSIRARSSIKVQRPSFDGNPETARGFHVALATYRHL